MAPGFRSGGFSVARNGTLAWRRGKAAASQATEFNRSGQVTSLAGPPFAFDFLLLSPDEKQLLAQNSNGSGWLLEVGRQGRTALPNGTQWFGWSADGSKIIGYRQGAIVEMPASGAGDVRELRKVKSNPWPGVVSPDGKKLIFARRGTQAGLYALALEGAATNADPELLVDARNNPWSMSISPDGRWLVYGSVEATSGLYVQPSSGAGSRRQIAPEGSLPVWRRDGREILYRRGEAIMAVSVEGSADQPSFGTPRELFHGVRAPAGSSSASRPLTVTRDGARIFYAQGVEQPEANVIYIKTGAFDGLR
jgi:hypothetical protein